MLLSFLLLASKLICCSAVAAVSILSVMFAIILGGRILFYLHMYLWLFSPTQTSLYRTGDEVQVAKAQQMALALV